MDSIDSTLFSRQVLDNQASYFVHLITSFARLSAWACILPVLVLAFLDVLGWAVFKIIWRPLGFYPSMRFKDPDPVKVLISEVSPSDPSSSPTPSRQSSSINISGLKRAKTISTLRVPPPPGGGPSRSRSSSFSIGRARASSVGVEGAMGFDDPLTDNEGVYSAPISDDESNPHNRWSRSRSSSLDDGQMSPSRQGSESKRVLIGGGNKLRMTKMEAKIS